MKRRGFLGALLGAPVAAKAAAAEAAGVHPIGAMSGGVPPYAASGSMVTSGPWSPLQEAKDRIAQLVKDEARIRLEARQHVCRLDADLASNRSMSLAIKMHIQAGRDAERNIARERRWAFADLDRAKKLMGIA